MFKKSLLPLLFWGSLSAFAQQSTEMPAYKAGADVVLKGISQYPAESGILYNRVLPFSGLDQTGPGKVSEWNSARFIQAVHELEEASLQPPSSPLAQKLIHKFSRDSRQGVIHLLAFNTRTDVIDTSRLIDSSLRVINREFRFTPREGAQSPLTGRQFSAAALMISGKLVQGKEYFINYPENISLGKQSKLPLASSIRLGQGPWKELNPGTPTRIVFSEAGKTNLSIRIHWEGGTMEEYINPVEVSSGDQCQDPMLFARPDDCPSWFSDPEFSPTWPSSPIEALIPFQGLKGRAEILHYLATGNISEPQNPSYRNPIIFIDGIDFGDMRKGQTIFGKYLSYLPAAGGNSIRLGTQLRNQGHDIIILNFPDGNDPSNVVAGSANSGIDGGCDYIERNAMTLIRLIQQVNQHLEPGSKKLSIAGPSMGGVIARYALAYMEKNVQVTGNHNCGLFLSMDAPQLGANIPAGLQMLLKNMSGLNLAEADQAYEYMKSPASTELLLQHVNRNGQLLHHSNRTQFLQNCLSNSLPGSLGWPRDPGLRMVALSNGNSAGQASMGSYQPPVPIESSAEMLSFNARLKGMSVFTLISTVFGGGTTGFGAGSLLSAELEFKTFYGPAAGAPAPVFRFSIRPGIFGESFNLLTLNHYWTALADGPTIDGAPGGISNTTGMLADGIEFGFSQVPVFNFNMLHADRFHPFIPTKSALGFHWNSDGIRNPRENFSSRNLTCTGEIPFHAYYCAPENQTHILLWEESVNFLKAQLNYIPPAGGIPYPAEIQGAKAVAAGSATEFSAVYQGNLEFRTTWSIQQSSGIHASLSNAQSQTCKVLVSSRAGQENGFFILSLITEVKSLSGDWVCAGRRLHKVQVRRTAFMGNIFWSCNPDLANGCSFLIQSGTPNYANLTNEVTHLGYEWQVSKYQTTDFSGSCWNGALSIFPITSSNPSIQKASVNLGGGFGTGNVFVYYVRVRNLMKIPNPDFGFPGEPEFLTIGGAWKTVQLETEVLPGPGCASCSGALITEPENPVHGTDHELQLRIPENWNGNYRLTLYDASGKQISSGEYSSSQSYLPLKNLFPGRYTIEAQNATGEILTRQFWLQPGIPGGLTTYPQTARLGQDTKIEVRILDEHFTEGGSGQWLAMLQNLNTGSSTSWTGCLQSFYLMLADLQAGNYELTLSNEGETIKGYFEVLAEGEEPVRIFPNPAGNLVHISIPESLQPDESSRIKISDLFGNIKLEMPVSGLNADADLGQLLPGMYVLQAFTGNRVSRIWFRKD